MGQEATTTTAVQAMRTGLSHSDKHENAPHRKHPWMVIHACELARDVLPLLEGQLAAGMRPSLLTPSGIAGASSFLKAPKRESVAPVSLLNTWGHVRQWRSLMN